MNDVQLTAKIDAGLRAWVAEHGEAPTGAAWSVDGLSADGTPIGFRLVNLPGFPSQTL